MEIIRAEAVTRLGELQEIKPKVYTSLELHPRRQMISRVQRQEQRKFEQAVQTRKVKLKKDISDIDKYLASVEAREEFFACLPPVVNGVLPIIPATLSLAPVILPAPRIVFGSRPMLRQTRMHRYKRGRRF